MATEDDFTFPTFTGAFSSAVDSPPLWSLSPVASPDSTKKTSSRNQQEEEEEECKSENCFPIHNYKAIGNDSKRRKSFSWIERSSSSAAAGHMKSCEEEDQHNKMDMLWEDFNEDLIISSLKKKTSSDDSYINYNLRLSKNAKLQQHRMMNNKSSRGFVMFIKVLKKLVFNMNNIVPRNHCSVHPRQTGRANF